MKYLVYSGLFITVIGAGIILPAVPTNAPIQVKNGFKVEKLWAPGEEDMGSWVSLAHVEGARFVASDQYGKIYWIDVPSVGEGGEVNVSPLEVEGLGKAQGLLWAFNSLYVMVNDDEVENSGLYRVQDTNGDGDLDSFQFLQPLRGNGEHGPHGVVLGPDGFLYVIAGNHTDLPDEFSSVLSSDWQEDRLYPSIKDPRGHARDRGAPGGWIARTDSAGSFWEVYASGFRNAYDIAFNEHGQLFTFDSDMEWDLGLPWYRPIRVCHVIAGAEFGWRTGSAKWPVHYPDNLPGVLDIGQGSPTGVISAVGLDFPAPYNKGLFVCDWSFGTMYHVGLEDQGASYVGMRTEFLSGVPLPLTDVATGDDGAMYFTTGGRRLESGLFRVWYDGKGQKPSVDSVPDELALRKTLEDLQDPSVRTNKRLIWKELGNPDRFIRYSARVALENHGVEQWMDRIAKEKSTLRLTEMGVAVARVGEPFQQKALFDRLRVLDIQGLTDMERLSLLRAQGLLIIRNSALNSSTLTDQWIESFPSEDQALNEEIAYLFSDTQDERWLRKVFAVWKEAPLSTDGLIISDSVAQRSQQYGRAIMNLRKRRPAAHKIALMDAMSHYAYGWTDAIWDEYFLGFNAFWDREGGNSYRGYLMAILEESLRKVPGELVEDFRAMAGADLGRYGARALANLPVPKGPGQNWTIPKVEALMGNQKMVANFENGEKMFDAALCRACHSMQGRGSGLGPELTQLGTRFSVGDIAVALVDPNRAVSDQYMISDLTLKDESTVTGQVIKEENDTLFVMVNPLAPSFLKEIAQEEVLSEQPSPRSWMFPGMLNRLNEQEVFDLVTYLVAGGDEAHEAYN